ncbi:MAG TPA: hypothetical protein VKI64_06940 [Acidimicrobiales bacterium]|nr:hypothetical protein [Acidimicrobiales bacterium]
MRRFVAAIRDWPTSARVVAGVLSMAVIALVLTAVAEAGGGGGGKPSASTGPTTTTQAPPAFGAGTTTSSSPGNSTATTKPGATTTASSTTTTARGAPSTAPTTSTTARATTTTAATSLQNGNYCRAVVSDPQPAARAPDTVTVSSTIANATVALVGHYKTGDVSYPAPGAPPVLTDGNGQASITFTVEEGSRDFPVVVDASVKGGAAQCETHFVPAS